MTKSCPFHLHVMTQHAQLAYYVSINIINNKILLTKTQTYMTFTENTLLVWNLQVPILATYAVQHVYHVYICLYL